MLNDAVIYPLVSVAHNELSAHRTFLMHFFSSDIKSTDNTKIYY